MLVCAVVILSGYLHLYISNPFAEQLLVSAFYLSAVIMISQWGRFFFKVLILSVKARIGKAKNTITWIEIPEFEELASEMKVKLNKNQPFGIMAGLDNAFSDPIRRQVIFGKGLLNRLERMERLALAAHEFTHLKDNHVVRQFFMPLALLLFISPTLHQTTFVISVPLYLAMFFMLFAYIGRRNEYGADDASVLRTNGEAVISLLRKSAPQNEWSHESEVHPSIDDRIARLSKKR